MPGIGGETFQIATSAETTVKELADKLVPILSDSGYTNVQVYHADTIIGDIRRNFSDTSKARKMLGWKAEIGYGESLRKTAE